MHNRLDFDTFIRWLGILGDYYQRPFPEELAEVLYEEFCHLTNEQFERGARRAMHYEHRFPVLSRFIELSKETGERRAELNAFEPDTTPYDPTSPEVRVARAKCRETIDRLKRHRRSSTSTVCNSGMSSLSELLR